MSNSYPFIKMGSWQQDIATNDVKWSDELFEILGHKPQEFEPSLEKFMTFVHPEDADSVAENYEGRQKLMSPYTFSFRIVLPSGEVKYIQAHSEIHYEKDRPVSILGIAADISGVIGDSEKHKADTFSGEKLSKGKDTGGVGKIQDYQGERLVSLAESLSDVVWIINPVTGKYIYMSQTVFDMLGYTAEELDKLPIETIFYEKGESQDYKKIFENAKSYVNGDIDDNQRFSYQFTYKHRSGKPVYVELSVRYGKNKVTGNCEIYGHIHDITDYVIARDSKNISELRFNQLAENLRDAIWIIDSDNFDYIYCSPVASKMLGYSMEEVLSNRLIGVGVEDKKVFVNNIREYLRRYKEEGDKSAGYYTCILNRTHKDGRIRNIEMSARLFENPVTHKVEIHGLSSDITERLTAEKEVKVSEEKFRLLAENLNDAVWILDSETGKYTYLSPAITKITGYTIEEITADPMISIRDPKVKQFALNQIKDKTKLKVAGKITHDDFFSYNLLYTHKNGTEVNVEVVSHLMRNELTGKIEVHGISRDITERIKGEKLLKDSELKCRMLAENMSDAVWIMDPYSCEYLYVSPVFFKITGYTAEELKENTLIFIPDPSMRDYLIGKVKEKAMLMAGDQISQETCFSKDLTLTNKSGFEIDVEVVVHFAKNENTGKIEMHGVAHDITERKLFEDRLRAAKDEAEASNCEVQAKNEEYEAINEELRLSNDELIKAHGHIIESENDLQIKNEEYEAVNEELRMSNDELLQSKDLLEKSQMDLQTRNEEYEAVNEELRQTNEELLAAKDRLEESSSVLKEAQSIAKMGSWSLDIPRNNVEWSDEMFVIFGCKPQQFKPTFEDYLSFVHPEDRNMVSNAYWEHINSMKPFDIIHRVLLEDGTVKYVVEKCRTQFDGKFKPMLSMATVADITDRILIEEELKDAKKRAEDSDNLKTAFLANMSHEIRTPLNAVIGFSDLLCDIDGESDDDFGEFKSKVERYSSIIRLRGNDLLCIINDILDVSKIQANQLEIKETECNINEMLDEVYSFFSTQESFPDKRHTVQLTYPVKVSEQHKMVLLDYQRIKQIFVNLITNAFKFTKQGSISMGATVDGRYITFNVKDTGVGIPKDKQTVIFEPFRQLDSNATSFPQKANSGTGLGLSICGGLVKLMNGEISVESEENVGSNFIFKIPYCPIIQNTVRERPVEENSYNWAGKSILIVEDDEFCSSYLVEIIKNTAAKVFIAETVIKALSVIHSDQKMDMILMDVRLPDGNGNDLTKLIRLTDPDVPIIAQTANAMENDREKSMDAGCNDYITKPLKRKEILALINKYMIAS